MNNTNNDDIFDFTGIIINLYYTIKYCYTLILY